MGMFNTQQGELFTGVRADMNKAVKGTPSYDEWLRKYHEKRRKKVDPDEAKGLLSRNKEQEAAFAEATKEITDFVSSIPNEEWKEFCKRGGKYGNHWFGGFYESLATYLKLRDPEKDYNKELSPSSVKKLKEFGKKLGLPGFDLKLNFRMHEQGDGSDYKEIMQNSFEDYKKYIAGKKLEEENERELAKQRKSPKTVSLEELDSFIGTEFPKKATAFKVNGHEVTLENTPYGEQVRVDGLSAIYSDSSGHVDMSKVPDAIRDEIKNIDKTRAEREESKEGYLKKVRHFKSFRDLVSNDISSQESRILDSGDGEISGFTYPKDFDWDKATEIMKKLSDKEIKENDVQELVLEKMGYAPEELLFGL